MLPNDCFNMKKTCIIILCLLPLQAVLAQTQELPSVFLEELTWTEVRDFLDQGGTSIILPTGGTEQNGPHMALGKHNARAKYMAERIALELGDALVAPTIAYVPEGNIDPPDDWMTYPGTISLPEETYSRLLEYACRSFQQHGFTDIILIGESGGNQQGMKMVSEALNEVWKNTATRVHFISDYYNTPYQQVTDSLMASGIPQEVLGFHAGVVDVSFLLAVDPSMIRKIDPETMDWSAEKKTAMGFSGKPEKAREEIGQAMIRRTLEISMAQIAHLKMINRKTP